MTNVAPCNNEKLTKGYIGAQLRVYLKIFLGLSRVPFRRGRFRFGDR
jgi:hypothetical protein